MRRYLLIPLMLLAYSLQSEAQDCEPLVEFPFHKGEKLSYELMYNWGFIWAKAGKVDFEVRDTLIENKTHFHFYSFGTSYKSWDWFYKVRSTYQSVTTDELLPIHFSRIGREGSHMYRNIYSLKDGKARFESMGEHGELRSKYFDLEPCALDVISGIYYCRSLDFSGLQVGDIIPLNLYLEGENFKSQLRYMGKEHIDDKRLNKEYDCIVFKPLLIDGTVFSEGENMTVYVTDDARRIPVYIETDLVVGKAKIYLMDE